MAREEYTGAAVETTLASGITNSDTSFTVADATGWPTGATGPFVVTIDRDGTQEKVLCTSRSGTTITGVTRGHDGTAAASHSAGVAVEHTISAAKLDDLDDHVYDTARDDHTQYLTNSRHDARDHSTALGTAVLADLGNVDATAPAADQVLTWDGDSWGPADVPEAGGLLAAASYEGVNTSVAATTTLSDVDTTNLVVTFTAPASGAVVVRLTGTVKHDTGGGAAVRWGLRDDSNVEVVAPSTVTQFDTLFHACPWARKITGLTPGNSYTYKWTHQTSSGAGTMSMGPANGQATMEVHAVAA